ncbi:MAG: hypothetical protein CL764_00925 [Chloroflexi bacterium]|nr:hypothetical protein [Chloroflexota bacterium]|tara:strand:- start:985 stop:1281 length:297 start_codon:yes stop_codon:yes gene_type:complete
MYTDLNLVRSDTLPEYSNYIDNGCDLFDSCLNCPLPRCRYDDPGWIQKEKIEERDMKIYRKRKEGCSIKILAKEYNLSTRTIHRAMRRIEKYNEEFNL